MRRKERQKKNYLGLRSFGRGNVKNRRGSGNKGGHGAAGLHKHRFTWITKNDPDYFGKFGFVRPNRKDVEVINLYEINNQIRANKLEKKEGKTYFEFSGKILGTGVLSSPVIIKALSWSKGAEEKIKKAGGEISALESIGKKQEA